MALMPVPTVTVVVVTGGRPQALCACIDSLLASQATDFEVLIVDNDPADAATRIALEERYGTDRRVRYLRERRPGVARARNTGLAFSRGEIVLFVDDDVTVEPTWVTVMAATLIVDPSVGCVAGPTLPAPAKAVGVADPTASVQDRSVFDPVDTAPGQVADLLTLGYTTGAGVNLGVRKSAVDDLWAFDLALGAGSSSAGADAVERQLATLTQGRTVVFEPRATVWRHGDSAEPGARDVALGMVMAKHALTTRKRDVVRHFRMLQGSARRSGQNDIALRDIGRGVARYVTERMRLAWASA